MYTETTTNLIINKMTKAKYNELLNLGQIVDTELYYIIDDNDKFYYKSETYSKEEVDTLIANLVNSAPGTLDTLGELATALQQNQTVVQALDAAITNKLDASKIIYSETEPENPVTGMIWLKPAQ